MFAFCPLPADRRFRARRRRLEGEGRDESGRGSGAKKIPGDVAQTAKGVGTHRGRRREVQWGESEGRRRRRPAPPAKSAWAQRRATFATNTSSRTEAAARRPRVTTPTSNGRAVVAIAELRSPEGDAGGRFAHTPLRRRQDRAARSAQSALGGYPVDGSSSIGLVIGVVASSSLLAPIRAASSSTIVLGIVGAMVGGWLGRVLGFYRPGEAAGFVMAIVGAIVILLLIPRRHATHPRAAEAV